MAKRVKAFDAGAFNSSAFPTSDYESASAFAFSEAFDFGGFHAPVVLRFSQPASEVTTDLVFTKGVQITTPDAHIAATIDSGEAQLVAHVALGIPVAVAQLDAGECVFASQVIYSTQTSRPLVANTAVRFQDAQAQPEHLVARFQDTASLPAAAESHYQVGQQLEVGTIARFQDADRSNRGVLGARFQDGWGIRIAGAARFQDGARRPARLAGRYQDADPVQRACAQLFQDGKRNPNAHHLARYQDARRSAGYWWAPASSGRGVNVGWGTRYQEGRRPLPGRTVINPPEPPFDPCYIPSGELVFSKPLAFQTTGGFTEAFNPASFYVGSSAGFVELVFVCDRHGPTDPGEPGETVVVPVLRKYLVINSATLKRVDGDTLIPTTAMSLTIDADSWTWSFTARVPGAVLPLLEPASSGEPVEVEAMINGAPYRALVEGISRERTFGRSDLAVTGRGRAAVLDAPYSPVMTFGNAAGARTVQQLANDVLTFNGVPIGWNIDDGWSPENWIVPAGVFSHQGSYMSALNAIAVAAGAYVQPHPTAKALRVMKRYPVNPWQWNTVTPDFELPAAVVQKESVVWTDKPIYNRVFVRGMGAGIIGQATRLGTAGDLEAPMVTDQLITNAIGARQRALPVLADVGRQAAVTLRLPVLAATGIITPGKFVRYVDGGTTRIGLVRSTSTEVQRADEKLTIWQTIGVETHVNV